MSMSRRTSQGRKSDQEISFEVSTTKKDKFNVFSEPDFGYLVTIPNTERKSQNYQLDSKIKMDQKTTPLKP